MQDSAIAKKAKTTLYMSEQDEKLLDEVFIKRLRNRQKTDRSTLLCEGIRLLYEKELGHQIPEAEVPSISSELRAAPNSANAHE